MVKGIPVSFGVGIARAVCLSAKEPQAVQADGQPANVEQELKKLHDSIERSTAELNRLQKQVTQEIGAAEAAILDAHLAFLQDPAFAGEMKTLIQEQQLYAVQAVQQVMEHFAAIFESLDDPYMRERAADVRDVGRRMIKNINNPEGDVHEAYTEPFVLVAEDVTPSDTISLPRQLVRAIVAAKGGATSHAAILARSLGIPAVMGAGAELLAQTANGDLVIVDGTSGSIHINPDEETLARYQKQAERERVEMEQLEKLRDLPAQTTDGRRIELVANIGRPEETEAVLAKGAEGVGLFRSEFLFMDREQLPTEEEQFAAYRDAVSGMAGKPVIIRTLDVGGDKHLPYLDMPKEENPFLGWRAIRISLDRIDLFKAQLRAILRASAFGKALIMFPMISHVEQIRRAKGLVEEAKQELRQEGIAFDEAIPLGIMIEIPAACLIADALAAEVDFFSIGTNDLVQYTLAVDRMNERLSDLYSYFHPAVLRLIQQVIDASHRNGIWTGMCGEMAADPLAAPLLLGMGLDEFSCNANSLPRVKEQIRRMSYQLAQEVAKNALSLSTPDEVKTYLASL
ncbi:phosphoenolpyruvate--protein phosphotransferase [Brevibacillus fluminis]|uniref:phosphoenolpyruvate--protein phosphotransferase n=1 Tax=Brevibacillus fluminis TaxID=511487 RepID=UPI003F89A9D0